MCLSDAKQCHDHQTNVDATKAEDKRASNYNQIERVGGKKRLGALRHCHIQSIHYRIIRSSSTTTFFHLDFKQRMNRFYLPTGFDCANM